MSLDENGTSLFHMLEQWNPSLWTGYRLVCILCWGILLHTWDLENIKSISSAVGEVVELDDNAEELKRLDRARVLIKTPWHPTIQHAVAVTINGEEYMVHIVEETCYNPCRCKCLKGCLVGSSDKILSDESEINGWICFVGR